ncbi:MAG TPA: DUF2235 domain-containing protein [Gammaproteobacteria bacterium]|jgi:uncharacterized protein (DUF2235 family)|nr:DUF2235 domain-containing protein [Pseudomonadota bacterium]HAY45556.1 DUF2235 domain-containing protein [Gammaproteobacteria bacterium]
MPRKLILCCDGTGNEIKENQSNVLKFYRLLNKTNGDSDAATGADDQIAYYDTGIGTISNSGGWSRFKNKAAGVFGLATGYGLDDNVLDAYCFLCKEYQPDDQIYLFGFSRGAYTVRVIAGLINMVGILKRENLNLVGYALTAYKQASHKDDLAIAWRVQEVLDTHRATIRFMGCWDTVGSVITPRPDRAYIPSLEELPFTKTNPCVQSFRHAMAIDERRRMFRLYPWMAGQKFKSNPFVSDAKAVDQDCKQVWFAGVHSDIGGGYPEDESGAAKIPLAWMITEAKANGLKFREAMVKRLVQGKNPAKATRIYSAPDSNADLHYSATGAWNLLEWLPKRDKYKKWGNKKSILGHYLPGKEPRPIAPDAVIHKSVSERTTYAGNEPYEPVNLAERLG